MFVDDLFNWRDIYAMHQALDLQQYDQMIDWNED